MKPFFDEVGSTLEIRDRQDLCNYFYRQKQAEITFCQQVKLGLLTILTETFRPFWGQHSYINR